jgi:DNA invertase Pin-like site-specific DNA recombinase
MNREKYLKRLYKAISSGKTYQKLAEEIGVNYVTLWRVINYKTLGSVLFWDKVIDYHKPKRK